MQKYEINKEIVFSTAHIPLNEASILKETQTLICDDYEYGFRILVPFDIETTVEKLEQLRSEGLPCVAALLWLARENDCKWLLLDADGEKYDGFPIFDWESDDDESAAE